jgi:hypothetical protein
MIEPSVDMQSLRMATIALILTESSPVDHVLRSAYGRNMLDKDQYVDEISDFQVKLDGLAARDDVRKETRAL